jgi:hypothetical protein
MGVVGEVGKPHFSLYTAIEVYCSDFPPGFAVNSAGRSLARRFQPNIEGR